LNTSAIGRLIFLQEWEQAVKMILSSKRDIDQESVLYESLVIFQQTGDPDKALTKLGSLHYSSAYIENTVLRSLRESFKSKNNDENSYKSAIFALPRETRSLYIHSYQSFIFNRIISRRIKEFGLKVLPGDLDANGQPFVFPDNENESDKMPKIGDVCLPMFSADCVLPKNQIGEWYNELLAEDGLSFDDFTQIDKSKFIIGPAYRPFIVVPKSVEWEFIEYERSNEELQSSIFIPLGGDTVLKNDGEEANKTTEPKEGCQNAMPEANKCGGNEKKRALKISFDLNSGSYATMALRELLLTDLTKFVQRSREFKPEGEKT